MKEIRCATELSHSIQLEDMIFLLFYYVVQIFDQIRIKKH
jgi:hypothetical protein